MTINKDIVHRDVHQQADKAHYHTRLGFCQTFTLVTGNLEEQIARRAPQQRTQITHGFVRQSRIDVLHGTDNVTRIPQHQHNENGNKTRQPETLSHLMRNALTSTGTI